MLLVVLSHFLMELNMNLHKCPYKSNRSEQKAIIILYNTQLYMNDISQGDCSQGARLGREIFSCLFVQVSIIILVYIYIYLCTSSQNNTYRLTRLIMYVYVCLWTCACFEISVTKCLWLNCQCEFSTCKCGETAEAEEVLWG